MELIIKEEKTEGQTGMLEIVSASGCKQWGWVDPGVSPNRTKPKHNET